MRRAFRYGLAFVSLIIACVSGAATVQDLTKRILSAHGRGDFPAAVALQRQLIELVPSKPSYILDLMQIMESAGATTDELIGIGFHAIGEAANRTGLTTHKLPHEPLTLSAQHQTNNRRHILVLNSLCRVLIRRADEPLPAAYAPAAIAPPPNATDEAAAAATDVPLAAPVTPIHHFVARHVQPFCALAVDAAPTNPVALFSYAMTLQKLNQPERAVPFAESAIALLEAAVAAAESPSVIANLDASDRRTRDQMAQHLAGQQRLLHGYQFQLCHAIYGNLASQRTMPCFRSLVRGGGANPNTAANAAEYHWLAIYASCRQRSSVESRYALMAAHHIAVAAHAGTPPAKNKMKCKTRESIVDWRQSSAHHTSTPFEYDINRISYSLPDEEARANPRLLTGIGIDPNTAGWVGKHNFFSVYVPNLQFWLASVVNGVWRSMVLYTDCAVFAGTHNEWASFGPIGNLMPPVEKEPPPPGAPPRYVAPLPEHVHVWCPVFLLSQPWVRNYYHWMAETIPRLLISREFMTSRIRKFTQQHRLKDPSYPPTHHMHLCLNQPIRYFLPSTTNSKRKAGTHYVTVSARLLGLTDDAGDIIRYSHHLPERKRYTFAHAWEVSWYEPTAPNDARDTKLQVAANGDGLALAYKYFESRPFRDLPHLSQTEQQRMNSAAPPIQSGDVSPRDDDDRERYFLPDEIDAADSDMFDGVDARWSDDERAWGDFDPVTGDVEIDDSDETSGVRGADAAANSVDPLQPEIVEDAPPPRAPPEAACPTAPVRDVQIFEMLKEMDHGIPYGARWWMDYVKLNRDDRWFDLRNREEVDSLVLIHDALPKYMDSRTPEMVVHAVRNATDILRRRMVTLIWDDFNGPVKNPKHRNAYAPPPPPPPPAPKKPPPVPPSQRVVADGRVDANGVRFRANLVPPYEQRRLNRADARWEERLQSLWRAYDANASHLLLPVHERPALLTDDINDNPEATRHAVETGSMRNTSFPNDLSAHCWAPKEGLWLTRREMTHAVRLADLRADPTDALAHSDADLTNRTHRIIYCSRGNETSKRLVRYEQRLLIALRAAFGDDSVLVFDAEGGDGGIPLDDQIRMFRRAWIVIGPHGAALTNILWTPPGTVMFEFFSHQNGGMFGHLCVVMGCHYINIGRWISSSYDGHYRMTDARARLVVNVMYAAVRQLNWRSRFGFPELAAPAASPPAHAPAPAVPRSARGGSASPHDEL